MLPVSTYARLNGVIVPPDAAKPHLKHETYIPLLRGGSDPTKSGGEVNAHKALTSSGDTVVIIVGGRGVSAVHAARQCLPGGHVYVYEPSAHQCDTIQTTLDLNEINNATIKNSCVGPLYDCWNSHDGCQSAVDRVSETNVHELPNHDVLELDCEGAEFQIIPDLIETSLRPRILIIEVHHTYGNVTRLFDELSKKGYKPSHAFSRTGARQNTSTSNGKDAIYCFKLDHNISLYSI